MIKASIIGAGQDNAGELIRILIHHPDVEIMNAYDPRLGGLRVDSVHHGLVGDTNLYFTPSLKEKTDVFFVCDPTLPFDHDDSHRIIDMTGAKRGQDDYVYGVGELNRKPLVRGATKAVTSSGAAHAAILNLLPLAQNLLLNSDIDVFVDGGVSGDLAKEISDAIKTLQSSFVSRVNVVDQSAMISSPYNAFIDSGMNERKPRRFSAKTVVEVDCAVGIDHVRDLFESYYDDHNFTFVIDREPQESDVANTNKCIIYPEAKGGSRLRITSVIDPRIKGDAGNAVHLMNLLFGLHERTGLNLMPVG